MPITAEYLRNQFRREMDDEEFPGGGDDSDSLWSNDDINDYMDQAQEEFCRKIDCIPDTANFSVKFKANNPYVELESVITQVRGGYREGNIRFIPAVNMVDIQRGYTTNDYGLHFTGDWRQRTGDIRYLVTDDTVGRLRAAPIPVEDTTILLSVYRLPERRIMDGSELQIPDMFRRRLLLKMRSLGYLKGDAETFNQRQADNFESRWQAFLSQAELDTDRLRGGSRTTSYGGV